MRKSRSTEEKIIAVLAEQERGIGTAEVCSWPASIPKRCAGSASRITPRSGSGFRVPVARLRPRRRFTARLVWMTSNPSNSGWPSVAACAHQRVDGRHGIVQVFPAYHKPE